jgi:hypothetical protein
MPNSPASLTRRLLAALETHARDDVGPAALADWEALSRLFDRELALLSRLATAAEHEGAQDDPELKRRAGTLRSRYQRRAQSLAHASAALVEERDAIELSRRRSRAVSSAYAKRQG